MYNGNMTQVSVTAIVAVMYVNKNASVLTRVYVQTCLHWRTYTTRRWRW